MKLERKILKLLSKHKAGLMTMDLQLMTGEKERKVEQAIQNLNRQGFLSSEIHPNTIYKSNIWFRNEEKGNYVSAAARSKIRKYLITRAMRGKGLMYVGEINEAARHLSRTDVRNTLTRMLEDGTIEKGHVTNNFKETKYRLKVSEEKQRAHFHNAFAVVFHGAEPRSII